MIWDHWQSITQQAHACFGDGPITVFLFIDSISSAMTQTATGGQGLLQSMGVACGCGGFCLWVLCADNAVTCSRPWEVRRTRIFIITDGIALLTMPATDPFSTSSVEIVEVASDYTGSVCSDFVHAGTEPVPSAEPQPDQYQWILDHLSNTSSDVASDVAVSDVAVSEFFNFMHVPLANDASHSEGVSITSSLPGTSSSVGNSTPTALKGWELVD